MQLEMDQRLLFKQVAALTKQSNTQEALELLATAVRSGRLDAEGCEKAGRLVGNLLAGRNGNVMDVRAMLLGQCTTSWIANNLTAVAWGSGCSLGLHQGEYDNVVQELMAPVGDDRRPQVVMLLPWNHRLLSDSGSRSAAQRLEDEVLFWTQAWKLIRERWGARILQIGYDWVVPGPLGHHLSGRPDGDVGLIRRLNEGLRSALPRGSFFLDLEQVSGLTGRDTFYDFRRYLWTKQPFSEIGVQHLATHLWAGIRAVMNGPKKCLVVDLDNTLWGGVVGETGPLGIELGETPAGEAFRAFQRYVKALSGRGVVLAISSKNNREDAIAPFEQNSQMALALSDFAHVEANWDPKSASLLRIAERLNLGLDSLVFFDDNPAEREQIRQSLPEVEVVDVPPDPSDYIRALQAGLWFESAELSEADSQRSKQYQRENQRREAQQSCTSMEEYLASLGMNGLPSAIDDTWMQRVVQLLAKTNQFNLTTRRHSHEDVRRLLSLPGSVGIALNLVDKFGDHGLISVLLAVPEPAASDKTLRIDTWLMSCRVIGRTVEQFFFNELLFRARELGYSWLLGEFVPTRKNALVADLFERLNFTPIRKSGDGTATYKLSLGAATAAVTYVRQAGSVESLAAQA
jgi:FkbH-like protein